MPVLCNVVVYLFLKDASSQMEISGEYHVKLRELAVIKSFMNGICECKKVSIHNCTRILLILTLIGITRAIRVS